MPNKPIENEIRLNSCAYEVRADGEGEARGVAAGVALPFNSETQIGNYFIERFEPGAFTETLSARDQWALIDHDFGRVLGRRSAGTLRFNQTNDGLNFEVDLPATTEGQNIGVSLERGDITGASIRFRAVVEEWDESGEIPIRTVKEAELIEVSIVANPQYDATDVALRAHRDQRKKKNFSNALRRMKMNQAQRERGLRTAK